MLKDHDTNSTVENLLRHVPAVNEDKSCLKVLDQFHEDKELLALPVVNDKDRPVGMILRHDLTEFFSKQYTKELKGKKPISSIMDTTPVIVDIKTGIDDIARIILDAGIQHMVSGFIITQEKRYAGMANGYDLLNEITGVPTLIEQKQLFG